MLVLTVDHYLLSVSYAFDIRNVVHFDLHSFPTRLSSDLGTPRSAWTVARSRTCSRQSARWRSGPAARRLSREIGRAPSELQSHVNLVCRLLLEKKKTQHSIYSHI